MKNKSFLTLLAIFILAIGANAEETITYAVDKQGGKFTSTNANGTWASVWTSTDGLLTLRSNANNMQWNGNNIDARSGTAKKATYTVTAPAGFDIISYSFLAKALSSNQTLTVEGESARTITSSASTEIKAEGLKCSNFTFTIAGENTGTLLSNFTVTVEGDPEAKVSATKVEQGKVTTGIGNTDVGILRSTLTVSGLSGNVAFQGVKGKLRATKLENIKAVRAYFATNAQELFIDNEESMKWRENNGILFEAAQYYAKKCDYRSAIDLYELAYEKDTDRPRFIDALQGIADIWQILGDYGKAAEACGRIVDSMIREWGMTEEVELRNAQREHARLLALAQKQ